MGELTNDKPAPRPDHPHEFGQSPVQVMQVAQAEGDGGRVEDSIGERQGKTVPGHKGQARVLALAHLEHSQREVHRDHQSACLGEGDAGGARASREVHNPFARLGVHRVDDGPAPAAGLAHGQEVIDEVISLGHLVEHRGDVGRILVEISAGHDSNPVSHCLTPQRRSSRAASWVGRSYPYLVTMPAALTNERIHVTTRPIPDPDELLRRLPSDNPVAWVRNGEGLIGWGVAARLEVRGRERFSRTQRWWNDLCSSLEIDDTVSAPGTGPVAFGSFTFDYDAGRSVVVVPSVIIGRRGGQAWMTTIGRAPAVRASIPPVAVPKAPTDITWRKGHMGVDAYQSAVGEAVRRIRAGGLDKVVLARDIVADVEGLDVRYLLTQLAHSYPTCWTFHVDGLVGATPELLVRRTGDLVTSRVLAGTVRRRGNVTDDAGLARELMNSGKDTEEHELAVQSVADALAAHCTDLDVPERPRVLELANVQHLATDVTGRLADGAPILALTAALHPTAAVCGTPTGRALATIRELEPMDRGRYSGPVGWFDRHGDGEFGIALRCAMIEEDDLRAYAGCGVVAGSVPEDEFAESVAKLLPIRNALGD